MNVYRATFGNKYFWATVEVVAATEDEAKEFFEDAVASKEWTDCADIERKMWIKELGDFDHDAYTYRYEGEAELHEEDTSEAASGVTLIKSGCNG